jgi:hypothetical protein
MTNLNYKYQPAWFANLGVDLPRGQLVLLTAACACDLYEPFKAKTSDGAHEMAKGQSNKVGCWDFGPHNATVLLMYISSCTAAFSWHNLLNIWMLEAG